MGRVLFESLYFGALGSPIAVCHAGGVVGGLGIWAVAQLGDKMHRKVVRHDAS